MLTAAIYNGLRYSLLSLSPPRYPLASSSSSSVKPLLIRCMRVSLFPFPSSIDTGTDLGLLVCQTSRFNASSQVKRVKSEFEKDDCRLHILNHPPPRERVRGWASASFTFILG